VNASKDSSDWKNEGIADEEHKDRRIKEEEL
jgi:hypothetical protein